MKVSATFHKKVPVPGIEYASQGFHCTLEAEPPPEIKGDREKLRRYVQSLFQECRDRVEQQLEQVHVAASPHRAHEGNGAQSGREHFARNGHARNGTNGTAPAPASPKQINYLRALSQQVGLGYVGLDDLVRQRFGKDLGSLRKSEASRLIDELRTESEA